MFKVGMSTDVIVNVTVQFLYFNTEPGDVLPYMLRHVFHANDAQCLQSVLFLLPIILESLNALRPSPELALLQRWRHPGFGPHRGAVARNQAGIDGVVLVADIFAVAEAFDAGGDGHGPRNSTTLRVQCEQV